MPVMWVVRIRAPEILVIQAFCTPIRKHSSGTTGMATTSTGSSAPIRPKHNSSPASTSRGSA